MCDGRWGMDNEEEVGKEKEGEREKGKSRNNEINDEKEC